MHMCKDERRSDGATERRSDEGVVVRASILFGGARFFVGECPAYGEASTLLTDQLRQPFVALSLRRSVARIQGNSPHAHRSRVHGAAPRARPTHVSVHMKAKLQNSVPQQSSLVMQKSPMEPHDSPADAAAA